MLNRRTGLVLLAGALALAWFGGASNGGDTPATATSPAQARVTLEDSLKKGRADGKYRMLLRQIKVDKDVEMYQQFKDLGYRDLREYAGHKELPAGHWVYVAPYWYIWRDLSAAPRPNRDWGPEQAIGEPDTNMAGDIVTAWASQSPDGQDEWLMPEYDQPIVPTAVLVYETYNPGALVRVTGFKLDGEEVELWKGNDPTTADNAMGVSEIPVKVTFPITRVKLYLDSANVPGWNEIDAVGLRDKEKKLHWATAVAASTTYAQPFQAVPPPVAIPGEQRIRQLENEVKELRTNVRELKESIDELKKLLKK